MNHSRIKFFLGLVFLTLFNATTCTTLDPNAGQPNPDGESTCAKFKFINSDVFKPSVVKVFFQLTKCNGEPWANVDAENFIIQENGEDVSQNESKQDFAPDPQLFQLATVLLLDMSGSIVGTVDKPGNLPALQQAAKNFLETIDVDEDQSIAIYTFDGRADIQKVADFTRVTTDDDAENDAEFVLNKLLNDIDSLSFRTNVDLSTNLNGAIQQGLEKLDAQRNSLPSDATMDGALVVFTDGTDQAARVSDNDAIRAVKESTHRVYAIGLLGELNEEHLNAIGKSGRFFAEEVGELEDVFHNAASEIRSLSDSFYALTYCSPKRLGTHKLTISLTDAVGLLEYSFNADNFGGTCSAQQFQNKESDSPPDDNNPTAECFVQSDCHPPDNCSIGVCYDGRCSFIDICIGD